MYFRYQVLAALVALMLTTVLSSQTSTVKRPPIVGVAHIALRTNDMAAARNFYGRQLGYEEAFHLEKPDGGLALTYFKVNDRQYIEMSPGLENDAQDRLLHIAFETTDVKQLRDYLASRGVKVPDAPKTGRDGNLSMMIQDPEGHNVEFVQYMPGSLHSRNFGKFLPATRISDHMMHVGFLANDRAVMDGFYKDILGFRLTWAGGKTDTVADWVSMMVPDGKDWLEYMLNNHNPTSKTRGVMNHLALEVPSVEKGYQTLLERKMEMEKPKIGRDGRWQLNLYDPNLTRAELMERKPVEKPCCSPIIEY